MGFEPGALGLLRWKAVPSLGYRCHYEWMIEKYGNEMKKAVPCAFDDKQTNKGVASTQLQAKKTDVQGQLDLLQQHKAESLQDDHDINLADLDLWRRCSGLHTVEQWVLAYR